MIISYCVKWEIYATMRVRASESMQETKLRKSSASPVIANQCSLNHWANMVLVVASIKWTSCSLTGRNIQESGWTGWWMAMDARGWKMGLSIMGRLSKAFDMVQASWWWQMVQSMRVSSSVERSRVGEWCISVTGLSTRDSGCVVRCKERARCSGQMANFTKVIFKKARGMVMGNSKMNKDSCSRGAGYEITK